jgi:aminoglycoside phosphotransferase (APT) family kinase protein
MPRQPIEQELAAVRTLAARLCLGGVEPAVLKLAKHTTLRLGPLVARVQSSVEPALALATMAREVAIARHLLRMGAPAVAPAIEPAPGPYEIDGCIVSLWAFVDHRPAAETDASAAGAALRSLHMALASCVEPLPPYREVVAECAALAGDESAMAAAHPDDRALLAGLVRAGLERLPADPARWTLLHGDSHLGNVLMTAAGPIWTDLEAVCCGPVEWDLANKPPAFLAAFEGIDVALLDQLSALRRACSAVWCWADAGRSREIREAAEYHTTRLRHEAASRFA